MIEFSDLQFIIICIHGYVQFFISISFSLSFFFCLILSHHYVLRISGSINIDDVNYDASSLLLPPLSVFVVKVLVGCFLFLFV